MKLSLYIAIFFFISYSYSQYNENAPWSNIQQKKSLNSKRTLREISNEFNQYWENKDFHKKGSGFKPFKRWENHWKNYLLNNGTLGTPDMVWKAWEQKKSLSKSNSSSWTSLGPYSINLKTGQGRVNTFIVDPNNSNVFYVGAPSGGIWKSINSGLDWIPLSDDIPQIGVSGIAIDPNNSKIIYIATGDDDALDTYSVGVLKSLDGGTTWNKTGLDFSSVHSISNEIYIHPLNSNILWVSTNKGFFKSINAGNSWTKTLSGNIVDFKLKPDNPNIIYAVSSSEFWRSTNGGNSFVKIKSNLPDVTSSSRMAIDVSPANPKIVYLLSADEDNSFQGLYKSLDSGNSFNKTKESDDIFGGSKQAWYDMSITVSPTNANIVFVGVLDIWSSTDGGDNFIQKNHWWNISEPSYTHADIHFLRFFNGKLYAGTDGGIYQSPNYAESFTDLTENLNISQYYKISMARHSSTNIVGGLQDNGGFAYNQNQWYRYHDGDGMDCAVNPIDPLIYYGFSQFGSSLNITYNGGITEGGTVANAPSDETNGSEDTGGNWVTPLEVNKEGEIYSGYSKLYKLNSNVWEAVSSDVFGGDLENIKIASTNSDIILVSRSNKLFKSMDKGITFQEISYKFRNTISSIEINKQNKDIFYLTTGGYGGKIYKSIDGGTNWTDITNGLPNEPKMVIKHQDQSLVNDLYLGTILGVYHIDDNMTDWELFDENLPNVPIYDIEISSEDNIITVGTYGRGVWQSPIPVLKADTDLSLIEINSHKSIQCGGITPVITIKNNGISTIEKVDIIYFVDEDRFTYQFNGNIIPNEIIEIQLPNNDIVNFGTHTLSVEATVIGDAFNENNSLIATFSTNNSNAGQYINTFGDINSDTWLTSTANNTIELWQKGISTTTKFKNKFDNSYTTNLTGNYADETTSYLFTPCYNLAQLEDPVLKFDMIFDIEKNWDVLYMEYTLDNGSSWSILGSADDPNWYNSDFIDAGRPITVGSQWTGTDSTIREYSYDLTGFTNESNIIFRFAFVSDQAENGEGVSIDNFKIDASAILATDNIATLNFSVYPNPSSGIFTIQRHSTNGIQLSVYDITGQLIYKADDIYQSNYILTLPDVSKGLYFLKIQEGNMHFTKHILVK